MAQNDCIDHKALFDQIKLAASRTALGETTLDRINSIEIISIIKDMPTVDTAPVIHAHWIEKQGDSKKPFDYRFQCSHCGHLTPENGYIIAPDYCGGCGAVMDEVQEKAKEESTTYSVCGYDKDNDVIETFAACEDIKAAAKKLTEITTEHLFEELKCKTTNEPFDWFNIVESKNKTVETIATGCVETKNGLKIAKIIFND